MQGETKLYNHYRALLQVSKISVLQYHYHHHQLLGQSPCYQQEQQHHREEHQPEHRV